MPDPTDKPLESKRDEEFASLYVNNTQFESTLWDLKITFGQVDLAKSAIEQHTAIALPWPHAKIAAYFLLINIIFHEAGNGRIFLPGSVVPKRPDAEDPVFDANGKKTAARTSCHHPSTVPNNAMGKMYRNPRVALNSTLQSV